ncbi:hypothetical protein SGPA1_60300 [Streptomyces misionensis JCM 4497]
MGRLPGRAGRGGRRPPRHHPRGPGPRHARGRRHGRLRERGQRAREASGRGRQAGRLGGGAQRLRNRHGRLRRSGGDRGERRRHHPDHPDGHRLVPAALVGDHGSVLALSEPLLGHPRPRHLRDGEGLRRPPPGALGSLARPGGRLPGRRGGHHHRLRHGPDPPPRAALAHPHPEHPHRTSAHHPGLPAHAAHAPTALRHPAPHTPTAAPDRDAEPVRHVGGHAGVRTAQVRGRGTVSGPGPAEWGTPAAGRAAGFTAGVRASWKPRREEAQAENGERRLRCRVRRVRGHHRERRRQTLLAQFDQAVVPRLAHQLRELGPVGEVHRLARAVRRRRRRAPPVQVVAAGAPAPAVVLPDGHLEHPRVVRPVDPLVRPPDRQLPAHVRLGLQRLPPLLQRQDVQRAARAAREPRPVLEDAGPLEGPRLPGPLLVLRDPAAAQPLVVVLPDVRREPGHVLGDPLLVVLVGEVRAQRAAAVVRAARLDALAAAAEDAVPARGQPGQIAAEDLLVVRRIGKLHPRAREVEPLLVAHLRPLGSSGGLAYLVRLFGFCRLRLFRLWHPSRVSAPLPERGPRRRVLAVAFRI